MPVNVKKNAAKARLVSVLAINLRQPLQNHARPAYYLVNPRNQGRKKKQINLTFTNRMTFTLHRSKTPSCLLYPPAISQHFKCYLLDAINRCTCIYLHAIINASPNLLSKLLILRTLKKPQDTACNLCAPSKIAHYTSHIPFSVKVLKLIFSYNSQIKPVLTPIKTLLIQPLMITLGNPV